MKEEARIHKSKRLARLLRFDKSYPYPEGRWRSVDDLTKHHGFTLEEIREIVENDHKNLDGQSGRFEISTDYDGTLIIRARDGHAAWMPRDRRTPATSFPDMLYHGTTLDVVPSILREGIDSGDRMYVHLSSDRAAACRVGARHNRAAARPVVLCIDTHVVKEMGGNLYTPVSEAWLSDGIPREAVSRMMLIGISVSFYESEEQGRALFDICLDSRTHRQIADRFLAVGHDMIRPINYLDEATVERIIRDILFENDAKYQAINAFIPLPVEADGADYDRLSKDLECYVEELQHSFLAAPVLELMPDVQPTKRKRALFYLEMGLWWALGSHLWILPVDWFDVRRMWEMSERYHFLPLMEADSISALARLLTDRLGEIGGVKGARCILWLSLPLGGECLSRGVEELRESLYDSGVFPLMSVSCNPEQKAGYASICVFT